MRLGRLWLHDFRNYTSAELVPAPEGLTVVVGGNGEGKTNLLEAVAYLATLSSFRGAPGQALVRHGCPRAVVRAEVERDGRALLVEAELEAAGRDRVLVNRQPLRRSKDLLGALRVSLFSPDDLALVKGGPAERRRYLDTVLVALHPRNDALQSEVERILRQRNALLKHSGGRLGPDAARTLDVWDAKLAAAGEALASARAQLVARLEPELAKAYDQVAGSAAAVAVSYEASWQGSLAEALAVVRDDDLRRGVTTVGPHRDELALAIAVDGGAAPFDEDRGHGRLPARTHASQGEQRSLALALRLAAHALVGGEVGTPPVLLLDDVFSELDAERSEALLAHLPPGQGLLTTTGHVPAGGAAAATVRVREGRLL